jgi:NADH-quinone oxidoreductase subunit C
MAELQAIAQKLRNRFPQAVSEAIEFRGELTLVVEPGWLLEVAAALRDDPDLAFDRLSDLCAVDHLPRRPRFDLNYHLHSMQHNTRLRLKARLPEDDPRIKSVVQVWPAANWYEREVHEMFGIFFQDHPDLRHLLLPDDMVGYPLRRDYPGTAVEENQFTHNFVEIERQKPYART